jgi:hypothetical protein
VSLRAQFFDLDDALASHGVPPLTTWWRAGIGRWLDAYEQGHALRLVACVGRGAAKSTALYKLALFFTLFGDFAIPIGERHFAIVLSRLKEEASKGIGIIARWLTLLQVPHHVTGDVIELEDQPRGIRVVAASVAASSGWRAYFVGKDERSKWPFGGVDDQDAEEIDTSAGAMTATHPNAPELSFGSAWGDFGSFYTDVVSGDDENKIVLGPAPTWEAAPHITEAACRRKERDARRFAREYACVFQGGLTSALDPDLVRRCLRPFRQGRALGQVIMAVDWSQGRGDSRARLFAQYWQPELDDRDKYEHEDLGGGAYVLTRGAHGQPIRKNPAAPKPELHLFGISALEGRWADRGITSDAIVSDDAYEAGRNGASLIFADEYMALTLQSAYAKYRLAFVSQRWTVESKADALLQVRQWLADGQLVIEQTREGQALVEEMIRLKEIIRPTGGISIGARTGHDDRWACLANVALAQSALLLPGSPIRKDRRLQVL